MDFDATGKLYGVSTLYNQLPTKAVGAISASDNLHALAVSPNGQLLAVNTNAAGVDQLVAIDSTTGALTTIGTLKDNFNHTYSGNFLALTFGPDPNGSPNGVLYGIVNDVDGSGPQGTGMALVRIGTTTVGGVVTVSNPSSTLNVNPGVLIKLAGASVTSPYNALVYGGAVAGNPFFWAVRHVGNVDILDRISITNFASPGAIAATAVAVGNILVNSGTATTHIVGMGFDENNHLIGMDLNGGGTSDLVGINTAAPTTSVYVSTPGGIANNLTAFAFGTIDPSFPHFQTFGYNTNAGTGGTLYINPGMVATLGTIVPGTGTFTEVRALSQDAGGTPLTGNVNSIAVSKSGTIDIFAVTDQGVLAEYDQFGDLVTGQPLGTVIDSTTGEPLSISRLAFDNAGHLVGIDATLNRLDVISTSPATPILNGLAFGVPATELSGSGTVNAAAILGLAFSPGAGVFLGFDAANSNFVLLLGTAPNSIGGITANSVNSLTITGSFYGGRVATTGSTGFGTITANGGGSFTGDLVARGSIGSFARNGDFSGTLTTTGNVSSIQILNGNVGIGGVIDVDGFVNALGIAGTLAGSVVLGRAGTVSIGSIAPTGILDIRRDTSGISIASFVAGRISIFTINSLHIGGQLLNGANIAVKGNAGSLAFDSGEALGRSRPRPGHRRHPLRRRRHQRRHLCPPQRHQRQLQRLRRRRLHRRRRHQLPRRLRQRHPLRHLLRRLGR